MCLSHIGKRCPVGPCGRRGTHLLCGGSRTSGPALPGRCLDKRLPQVKVGLERLPRVLGMPLYAQAERLAFDFDAFGNAVGCLGDQVRALPRTVDAAVMLPSWSGSACARQPRASSSGARHDLDGVHGVVEQVVWRHCVPPRAPRLGTSMHRVPPVATLSNCVPRQVVKSGFLARSTSLTSLNSKRSRISAAQRGVVRTLVAPAFGVDVRAAGNGDAVRRYRRNDG